LVPGSHKQEECRAPLVPGTSHTRECGFFDMMKAIAIVERSAVVLILIKAAEDL
jgi:hypothetical protein